MAKTTPNPRILVFIDHYLPGYRAGGPLRTISAMVKQLSDEFSFLIVTSDRDLGGQSPYRGITPRAWTVVEGAATYYLGPSDRSALALHKLVATTPHDVLYLNSVFSFDFSIKILLLRRLGLLATGPVVLAPRGELGAGAMRGSLKKRAFIRVARALGLHRNVMWQGSTAQEAEEIQQHLAGAPAYVAPDLADTTTTVAYGMRPAKAQGSVRLLFLSRVVPKKNLYGAIDILRRTSRDVLLSVCGPLEDGQYWRDCRELVTSLPHNVRFNYLGEVPHGAIPPVLQSHDALFLPTHHENFGHVILESLAAGTPVLISDQTPWRQLRQQCAGWDLPLDQPDLFLEAIDELAEMDEAAFIKWSRGAQSTAERWFASGEAVKLNRSLLRAAYTSSH